MSEENKKVTLPENAFRELKPGEKYQPLLNPDKVYPEVTVWSVTIGLVMTIIFSAAAAFLGLKVGQVFEAAIGGECHHPVHRSLLRGYCCWSYFHSPCPVYPAGQIP